MAEVRKKEQEQEEEEQRQRVRQEQARRMKEDKEEEERAATEAKRRDLDRRKREILMSKEVIRREEEGARVFAASSSAETAASSSAPGTGGSRADSSVNDGGSVGTNKVPGEHRNTPTQQAPVQQALMSAAAALNLALLLPSGATSPRSILSPLHVAPSPAGGAGAQGGGGRSASASVSPPGVAASVAGVVRLAPLSLRDSMGAAMKSASMHASSLTSNLLDTVAQAVSEPSTPRLACDLPKTPRREMGGDGDGAAGWGEAWQEAGGGSPQHSGASASGEQESGEDNDGRGGELERSPAASHDSEGGWI